MNKRISKFLVIATISLLLILATYGCATLSGEKEPGELDFVFVDPVVGDPYWVEVDQGCIDRAEELGVNMEIIGPTEVDADAQINYIETSMAEGVDGIVTMALNPPAFIPIIDKAVDAGIPVMLVDGDAAESKRNAFFGTNPYESGITSAEVIEEFTDGNAKVGIVTAGLDIQQINERIQGIEDYFEDKPNMEIVAIEDFRADQVMATELGIAMIQANPDINVLFGAGAVDTPGVAQAVVELDLVGEVLVIGMNDTPQALDYLRDGVIQAILAEKPYAMCYMATDALYKTIVEGEEVTGVINTGVTVVTEDNIDTYKEEN